MPNVDWDKIRAEYIAGKLSQRKLAEKYGVSVGTLQWRAQREGWTKLREEASQKVSAKLVQKTASQRANAAAEVQRIGLKMLRKIEREIDKMVDQPGTRVENTTVKAIEGETGDADEEAKRKLFPARFSIEYDFGRLASAFSTVARTLGADAAAEHMQIERERLALEREKFEIEHGNKDEIDAINADILSLADLINNPQPDRNLEDIMRGEADDA